MQEGSILARRTQGPLAGVRIVDMTSVVMGPLATQILGDMGADIIKVEPPAGGDVFRHVTPARSPGMGASFLNLNRNKRSIVLDLKDAANHGRLLRLIERADVLIFSLRPRAMRKLGLDYLRLQDLNPRLIYCGAYGFSERGPYAGRPAFDDIIQALSGLAAIQQDEDTGTPTYVNTILADKVAGLTIVYSTAIALYERERSGMGQAIEVPMFETMAAFNLLEHLAGHTFHPPAGPIGYDRLLSRERRPYRTQDGYLAVMPYTTEQWHRFFALCDPAPEGVHALYEGNEARSRNIGTLYRLLADVLSTRSTAQWLEALEAADIPHSRVNTLDDLMTDPHLDAVGLFARHTHPSEGDVMVINPPVHFSRTPCEIHAHAPRLGESMVDDIIAEWNETRVRHDAE